VLWILKKKIFNRICIHDFFSDADDQYFPLMLPLIDFLCAGFLETVQEKKIYRHATTSSADTVPTNNFLKIYRYIFTVVPNFYPENFFIRIHKKNSGFRFGSATLAV
jgi:hypothetical protein